MPFEKGHKGYKQKGQKKKRKNHQTLDTYNIRKDWEKGTSHKTLDPELVDYYINNDLDLNELYDNMKLYDYGWKNGNKNYNLNSEAKKKRDEEGM